MSEATNDLDLAQKPLGPQDMGDLGAEYLHRDTPVVLQVLGEVDGRHAALAELVLQQIAGAKRSGEFGRDVSHRHNPR